MKESHCFFVAEDGEFKQGLFVRDLTIEEAIEQFNRLSCPRGIPVIGIEFETFGYPSEFHLVDGKRMDLDTLLYIPDLLNSSIIQEAVRTIHRELPELVVLGNDYPYPIEFSQREKE